MLRKIYQEEMAAYEKACQEFKDNVLSLLEQQSALRPVSQIEKELLLANIQHRFQGCTSYFSHHLATLFPNKTYMSNCSEIVIRMAYGFTNS